MSSRIAFIDLCLEGKVPLDDIDNFIDQWHETPEGFELHDYLGMTQEEYSLWLRVPDALPYIITARHEAKSLADVVASGYQDLRFAAQPSDKAKIVRLQKWLKAKGEVI
jgi:hypothetical protein